jgi:hypothetical protein
MAITKANASGLSGSKFKDASAGTAKIPDVPDTPTIGAPFDNGNQISIAFTSSNKGGIPTSYTATASPGGAQASANSSPITYSANALTAGTAYSFTVRAETTTGNSPFSSSSVNHVIPSYVLSQTFNSSGTFEVPAGITKMGLVGQGAGANGANVSESITGASGGGGGGKFIVDEITVTPGTKYSVTIGGAGGSSSFGSIAVMNAANVTSGGNVSVNTGNVVGTAAGGSGGNATVPGGHPSSKTGLPGNAGGNSSSITTNTLGMAQTLQGGGGGGGGGDGSYRDDYYSWNKPGGAGGAGGTFGGGVGNSGAGSSGGGGGGARGGNIYSPFNSNYGFVGGGSGGAAQIKVYVKG